MDQFPHLYQTSLNTIMQEHDYIILDNIFPIPLYRNGKEHFLADSLTISRSTTLAQWWEKTLQNEAGKIVMPWEIYKQALQGYGIATKRNSHFLSSPQEYEDVEKKSEVVEKYLGIKYSLLAEARKHIFNPASGEHDIYASVAAEFKDLALEYHLKKENHHDDNGADESLAAAASYFSTQRSARCAIITNDGDIDRIVNRCLSESENKLVTVY